jgi:hypothetical protein
MYISIALLVYPVAELGKCLMLWLADERFSLRIKVRKGVVRLGIWSRKGVVRLRIWSRKGVVRLGIWSRMYVWVFKQHPCLIVLQEASTRVTSYQRDLDSSLVRLRKLENRVGELVGREEAMLEEQRNGKGGGKVWGDGAEVGDGKG